MLADIGDDDRILADDLMQRQGQIARIDRVPLLRLRQTKLRLKILQRVGPLLMACLRHPLDHVLQDVFGISHDGHIRMHVLGDLRRVDVKMDDLGILAKFLTIACHTIRETRADRDDQIRVERRIVGHRRAMHADHAQIQIIIIRHGRQAHHARGDRNIHMLGEAEQLLGRSGADDAAAGIDQWTLSFLDGVHRLLELGLIHLGQLADAVLGQWDIFRDRCGHILGNVDEHRPLAP